MWWSIQTTFGAPSNVTVDIDQDTGLVTLTPDAGFTGTINLLAGVRSATADDEQANYNTEAFTLTVNAEYSRRADWVGRRFVEQHRTVRRQRLCYHGHA